jgi:hypothetical protein
MTIGFFVSLCISFCISKFVLDKFKFSDNNLLKFLQRFIIGNIVIFLLLCVGIYIIDFFPTVYCSSIEDGNIISGENSSNNTTFAMS